MPELLLTIPHALWMSSNDRMHPMAKAKRTRAVRELAQVEARNARLPHLPQVHIAIYVGYPSRRKADPPNAWPTVKAAIDGIVDSGALVDDSSEFVYCHSFWRERTRSPQGTHTLRLVLTDQALPF